MNRIFLIFSILLASIAFANGGTDFFSQTDSFLKKYVKNDLVNYAAIKAAPAELDELVAQIEAFNINSLEAGNAQKAFWINSYNVLVIKGIVENYPTKSPLAIEGFFKTTVHRVAGQDLTLDAIENEKIRAAYGDARIHFALVCAALGCPPIKPYAYWPEKLDEQLAESTTAILNDGTFIRLNSEEKTVLVSEIFKWFRVDFETDGQSILQYINPFLKNKIPADYILDFYPYNWDLNEAKG